MTSTSFNPIQIQQTNLEQTQPLALKQGQVFHGTIKKLYPDQMAEIQVGQNKLFAKLETPLKAFDSHFFQVTNMNPQAEVKVVSGPIQQSQTTTQQLNQLLDTMNLPKTQEMQQVLTHFVKNQLPLSKETLLQAENWMKNLPESVTKEVALQSIQKIIELKMPFTNEVFKGLLFGSKVNGMSSAISNLTTLLSQDTSVNGSLKSNILEQLRMISKPLASETGGVILAKAVEILFNQSESATVKSQVLQLLKDAEIVPKGATVENWLTQSFKQHQNASKESTRQPVSQLLQNVMTSKPSDAQQVIKQLQTWLSNQESIPQEQKAQLQQLVSRFETLPNSAASLELFAKQLHQQLVKGVTSQLTLESTSIQVNTSNKEQLLALLKPDTGNSQLVQSTLSNLLKIAEQSNSITAQSMQLQAETEVLSSLEGKMMGEAIKTVIKSLGMSYEAALNSKFSDVQELAQSLKPQLLLLSQDPQSSAAVKEAADNILSRLNGMQLTSGENGPQHQLVMQIPLQFLGKQTEATVQWNGRMKKNGKIDANYARILFYLDMEALEETMVDMQVQNRIITINVYNNQPQLEEFAEPLKETLKNGLLSKNYQLSGLFVKPFENTTAPQVTMKQNTESKISSGVDIRI